MVEASEQPKENDNPELAMREQCTKHGEFKRKEDGTLEFKDYVALRAIITRQAARLFAPKRKELDSRKLEAFKGGDDATYVRVFREGKQHQE